jgi:hypothetical protein
MISSPLINNGETFCFDSLSGNGFFIDNYDITLTNETENLIQRIFNYVPHNLNGYNMNLTFGISTNTSVVLSERYNLLGNTLEIP